MMEIKIRITDVDYAAAVDELLPVLADKLSGCSNPIASLAFGKANNLSASAAKAALKALPQSMKDELAAACLNRYSGGVSQALTTLAAQRNLFLNVEGVEVSVSN